MNALLLALVFSQAPATVAEVAPPPSFRLHVGAEVGFPFIVGVKSTGTFFVKERPRFDVDVAWEPSVTLQSYSVGGAYHVLDRWFFVGARVRLLTFQPSWARGSVVPYLGLGLEAGARIRVGPGDKGVISIALHGTGVPAQASNLQWLVGLSAGFSWSVFEK